ncbi:type II toxin-antitoxin system RelE/ParE family toxin [Tautonia plasticadhaerens]|uniref:Plasmid stabilization system protein n=1 Tax=Tautonia plasticadhaerens TaxID=2527974 RepID=A0A518HCZ4_9BACT|nr:type II toxin-antitoxin system RelE/ParE family toxin [Tautonia plasticadhaerens]QDV38738.1 Plasmid stabilization system protein [Tautonia plasticadhaerens]
MSLPLVIRRAARVEFDEAFDWYERQEIGLGVKFADRVQATFDSISAMPELHALVYRDVRKALVKPYPYSIFYRIRGHRVVVLAVFHSKRDPKIWKSRV